MKKIKYENIIFMFISLIAFIVMIMFSSNSSLWADDVAQISFSYGKNIFDIIHRTMLGDCTPPLFSLIGALWIRIVPYGTAWLRLLSEIFVFIGIFFCGKIGYELCPSKNSHEKIFYGLIIQLFAIVNRNVIVNSSYVFRSYGLYFMLSALLTLYFIKLKKDIKNKKNWILYTITISLISYTHYFGLLLIFGFFVYDLLLFIRKKVTWKFILPYVIAGILYIPWIIAVFPLLKTSIASFWPNIPTMEVLINSYGYLFNNTKLFVLVIIILITLVFLYKILKHKWNDKYDTFLLVFFLIVLFMPLFIYIYSVYINNRASLFVERYFFCVLPLIFIIETSVIYFIFNKLLKKRYIISLILIAIIFAYPFNKTIKDIKLYPYYYLQDWEYAANWMNKNDDINNEDTVILISNQYGSDGFRYYLTHKNTLNINPKIMTYIDDPRYRYEDDYLLYPSEENFVNINTIYLYNEHILMDERYYDFLIDNYDIDSEDKILKTTKFVKKER